MWRVLMSPGQRIAAKGKGQVMGFVITEHYDSEALAGDIANVAGDMWNVEVGEMSDHGHGHAFTVDAPDGRRFMVAVTGVAAGPPA